MRYFVRAVKYFLYLLVILALVIAVLVISGMVDGDLSTMFVNGYDSYWQIALIAAALAALYPRMGYCTRTAHVFGEPSEAKSRLDKVMGLHGYKLEKSSDHTFCDIKRSPFTRALKMWEDKLTCTVTAAGVEIEGSTKDVVRIISGLEAGNDPA